MNSFDLQYLVNVELTLAKLKMTSLINLYSLTSKEIFSYLAFRLLFYSRNINSTKESINAFFYNEFSSSFFFLFIIVTISFKINFPLGRKKSKNNFTVTFVTLTTKA